MLVKINGKSFTFPNDSKIGDAIKASGEPHVEGTIAVVIHSREELLKHTGLYLIKTNKGIINIKLESDSATPLIEEWRKKVSTLKNLKITFTTKDCVAIGHFSTTLQATKGSNKYDRWETVLSLTGFDPENSHVIISKRRHEAEYCVPKENRGVFAKVVSGRFTIEKLQKDDQIQSIEPIIDRSLVASEAQIADMNEELHEGLEIFTFIGVNLDEKAPHCSEYALSVLEDKVAKVDDASTAYARFKGLKGLVIAKESLGNRSKGSVTVRNTGSEIGDIYIYKSEEMPNQSHSVIGNVYTGLEMLDAAKKGDKITIITHPSRIMVLGQSQAYAKELLSSMDIKQVRSGLENDDAIITTQIPKKTFEILKQGSLKTHGLSKNRIVKIILSQDAPRTGQFFRTVAQLLDKPVGFLKVHFKTKDLIMFKSKEAPSEPLIPENIPVNMVKAQSLGITNMSTKHAGLIGIRLSDSEKYGPTGENLESTNIIGQITEGIDVLKKAKDGEIIHFIEEKSHE